MQVIAMEMAVIPAGTADTKQESGIRQYHYRLWRMRRNARHDGYYLPDEFQNAEVKFSKIEKLGSSYNAMTVMRDKNGVSPSINLDSYYEEYQNGCMLQECLQRMARMIRDFRREFNVDWIQDYDQAKQHLFIRVSNADKNVELLEKVPHELKDDLVITCHLEVSNEYGSLMSAIVSNQMLDMYGVSEQQIIQDAIENSVRIMPPTIRSLGEIVGEYTDEIPNNRRMNDLKLSISWK